MAPTAGGTVLRPPPRVSPGNTPCGESSAADLRPRPARWPECRVPPLAAEGLKPGTYKAIIFLGGDSVETKVFVVKE